MAPLLMDVYAARPGGDVEHIDQVDLGSPSPSRNPDHERRRRHARRLAQPARAIPRLFADVRPGQGVTVVLLMLNVFMLLCCYYIIKPVRRHSSSGESAEVKSYASAVMAVVLVVLVPAYGNFASRVDRMRLITVVSGIFVSNLVLFHVLGRMGLPHVGIAFFIWVGIFNMMIIAQFWSFANDVFTREEGGDCSA